MLGVHCPLLEGNPCYRAPEDNVSVLIIELECCTSFRGLLVVCVWLQVQPAVLR